MKMSISGPPAGTDSKTRLHKQMALTGKYPGGSGTFNCCKLSEVQGGSHEKSGANTTLSDSQRAGPPHISRGGRDLPGQAHSDHGPHHHGHV